MRSFAASDYFLFKLIVCLPILRRWTASHLNTENVFPYGQLERPIYIEMPKYVLSKADKGREVLRLRRSFSGVKDAAKRGINSFLNVVKI